MPTQQMFPEAVAPAPFAGADYVPQRDEERLMRQVDRIVVVVLGESWLTIERLVALLRKRFPGVRFPENSVQAQLRNLRKVGYTVERQSIGRGLYQYRVLAPLNPGVGIALRKEVAN